MFFQTVLCVCDRDKNSEFAASVVCNACREHALGVGKRINLFTSKAIFVSNITYFYNFWVLVNERRSKVSRSYLFIYIAVNSTTRQP